MAGAQSNSQGTPQGTQGNQQQSPNPNGNPLQQLGGQTTYTLEQSLSIIAHNMEQNPNAFRQAVRAPTQSQSRYSNDNKWTFERRHSSPKFGTGNILNDFENGITKGLKDALVGGDFKDKIQGALDIFAKEFGTDIRDLPHKFGQQVGQQLMSKFKNSDLGKSVGKGVAKLGNSALDAISKNFQGGGKFADSIRKAMSSLKAGGSGSGGGGGFLGSILSSGAGSGASAGAGAGASAGAAGAGAGVAGGGMTALAATGWGALIIAIIYTIYKILEPALKSLAEVAKALGQSWNRSEKEREKKIENARKRLEADMEWMAKRPFEILENAAKAWEDAWDNNLRNIGQTQGYDKESVYALYESYAKRLKEDQLESAIPATDIVNKLSQVLSTGLSGVAAEEFAYTATKLGAAIPTQDFFGYAETYASIAANAISQGKSQKEALTLANQELYNFANNLLYSSRELAGGFSTGLKNSTTLFNDAVKIAQSAKSANTTAISGTLTSVSAIIGAVAPDLASGLVDNIVQAAIGGNNSSSIVALRSLAGINAGNTEFLKAMADDPKKVFSTLFTNLASLQTMSPDNYMEVAEGLSEIFGVDKSAFARVDFNYLAKAIDNMNTASGSLSDNLNLLASGETTTSEEQLKNREIAKIIVDEGLAYVIDSEAGRMVQQHMWDEQMKNEMMSNEYAVNLQGRALELLESLKKVVVNILDFFNPAGFISKGIDGILTDRKSVV